MSQSIDFSSGGGPAKPAKSNGTHLKRLTNIKQALESYDPHNVMEAAVRKLKEKFNAESRITELYKRGVHTEDVIGKLSDENRLNKQDRNFNKIYEAVLVQKKAELEREEEAAAKAEEDATQDQELTLESNKRVTVI